jgi:hypothetical protein
MFCSFNQAIPGGLQVVVPVWHIWRRRTEYHQARGLNLNMRVKWGCRSYRIPAPPNSCGVRVRHCDGRWCPADHIPDAECDGAADGWSSVHAWRFLLQLRNRRGCTQGFLQYQRCPPVADRGWIKERWITRLQSKSRERDKKRRLLSDGSLLWWEAVLLEWLFPLVRHGLGGFFWKRRTRGSEMMEVCVNGFAEHRRGYFISSGSASWVMTGWRALMRIPNGGGFPWTRRVFSSE